MPRIINLYQIRTGHVQENRNYHDSSVAALSGDKKKMKSHYVVSCILHVIAIIEKKKKLYYWYNYNLVK